MGPEQLKADIHKANFCVAKDVLDHGLCQVIYTFVAYSLHEQSMTNKTTIYKFIKLMK